MSKRRDERIQEALEILGALGMPEAQQNERSALCLLALADISENTPWASAERPALGVTPVMQWIGAEYGKKYAPNTRETIRRETLHQFVDGGIAAYNLDKPDRPVNSPHANYQLIEETRALIARYGTPTWPQALARWKAGKETLVQRYSRPRDLEKVPLRFQGVEMQLSPGRHSELMEQIVSEFGPRFAPGAKVLYLGDTGAKQDFFDTAALEKLGLRFEQGEKMPDVILHSEETGRLFLIEAVTSHGPIDPKRQGELLDLFGNCGATLIFVTAFPDKTLMAKHLASVAWETEVWVAGEPDHMIHLNGARFLNPGT